MDDRRSIIQRLIDYASGKLDRERLGNGTIQAIFRSERSKKRYATLLANRFERENALIIEYKNSTLKLEPVHKPHPDQIIPEGKFIAAHVSLIGQDGRIFNIRVGLRTGERFSQARLDRAIASALPADIGAGGTRSNYVANAAKSIKYYIGEYVKKG